MISVLHAMQVPGRVIKVVEQLYNRCKAIVRHEGASESAFLMESGIKQGCPASGSLFALALDPFVRMLLARLPSPHSLVVACADDLATALHDIMKALPILYRCFLCLEHAACLAINPGKCIIVPNFGKHHSPIKRYIVESLPAWTDFSIASHGRLLGFELGPGAEEVRWKLTSEKFWARGLAAKQGSDGLSMSIRRYNLYAVNVLSHLAQLDEVPKAVLDMEAKLVQSLARGPWNAWTPESILSLTDLGFKYEAHRSWSYPLQPG
jgi:hypothetical protein